VALGGVASTPVRANATELLLERKSMSDERVEAAVEMAADGLTPEEDFRGSAEYRRAVARVLTRRALFSARVRAQAWGSAVNVVKGDDDEDRSNN
jgi:carbon-monoxide dehydrogenase medium subunit